MVDVTIELQSTIIIIALIAGGIRGIIGYYLNATPNEGIDPRKIIRTLIRYSILNLLAINGSAAIGGVTWTVVGVIVISFIWLAQDIGVDTYKTLAKPTPP